MECKECYSDKNRITPLLGARECLENPFKSLDIAKLYLRTADYTNKKCCGIYEIENSKGRKSYKIFASDTELNDYLSKNKDKICNGNKALFTMNEYKEFNNTQIKHLSQDEVEKYLSEM